MSVDYKNYYEKYIKELKEKVKQQKKDILKQTSTEFFELLSTKIRNMFEITIIHFYSSYSPKFYKRRDSLFNLLKIDYGNDYFEGEFIPEKIISRTGYKAEDGLYDTVFRQGWHGGAKHNGSYYWRKPDPCYNRWGRQAIKAQFSPLQIFNALLDDYKAKEIQEDWNKLYNKNISKINL